MVPALPWLTTGLLAGPVTWKVQPLMAAVKKWSALSSSCMVQT